MALVAGAPDGIGRAVACQLASAGDELVVASDPEVLASRDGVGALHQRIEHLGRPLDVVNINVVVGRGAPPVDRAGGARPIDLHVRGAIVLAELCLPGLVAQGTGGILFTSSGAQGPSEEHLAAFVARLQADLEGTGVAVAHLVVGGCPAHGLADVARRGIEQIHR